MTGPLWRMKKQMFTPVSERKKRKAPERKQKRPWVGISSYIRWIIPPQPQPKWTKILLADKIYTSPPTGLTRVHLLTDRQPPYVASLRWNVWKGPSVEERQEEDVFLCIRWPITSIKVGLHWLALLGLEWHSTKLFSTKLVSSCKELEITSRVD